jgi:hypothetical protein
MTHEGPLESRICEGKIVFVDGRGRAMPAVATKVATADELEQLEQFLRDADLHIDGSTASTWDGTRVGIAEALDWRDHLALADAGVDDKVGEQVHDRGPGRPAGEALTEFRHAAVDSATNGGQNSLATARREAWS